MTSKHFYPHAIVALMLLVLAGRVLGGWYLSGGETSRNLAAARQESGDLARAEDYDAQSVRYYQAGMPEKSAEASRQAIRLNPNVATYFNNLCAAYNNLGRYDDAVAACRNALKIDPALQLARNNLGWALNHGGKN